MELKIRKLTESDWDLLVSWWEMYPEWKQGPSKKMLPENGTGGYIVEKGEIPIVAGFLYTTNSKVGWMEWVISNKKYTNKSGRKASLILLIEALTNVAQASGNKFTYALIKHDGLIKTYEELGYIKGDSYNKEMIKVL